MLSVSGCATYGIDGFGGGYASHDRQAGRQIISSNPAVAAGNQPFPGGLVGNSLEYIMALDIPAQDKADMIQTIVLQAETNRVESNSVSGRYGNNGYLGTGRLGGGVGYSTFAQSRQGYIINSTKHNLIVQIDGLNENLHLGPGDERMITTPTSGRYNYRAYLDCPEQPDVHTRLYREFHFQTNRNQRYQDASWDFVHRIP